MSSRSASRLFGIDCMRFIAAVLVICIHTNPLRSISPIADSIFIQTVCRMAVPFFFICSGYFCAKKLNKLKEDGQKIDRIGQIAHLFRSIGPIYFSWTIVYMIIHIFFGDLTLYPLSQWWCYIDPGIYPLLWFMPALLLGEIVYVLFFSLPRKYYFVFCSLVFLVHSGANAFQHQSCKVFSLALWMAIYYVAVGVLIGESDRIKISAPKLWSIIMLSFCGVCGCYFFERHVCHFLFPPNFFLIPASYALWELLLRWGERASFEKNEKMAEWFRNMSVLLYVLHGFLPAALLKIFSIPLQGRHSLILFLTVFLLSLSAGEIILLLGKIIPLKRVLY